VLSDGSRAHNAARLRRIFRALPARNYRLYFGGQGLSLIGTWMQQVALSWLVYRLTHSALMLGVVSGAGQLPVLLLAPFAGVVVDRWDRHRLLMVTQTGFSVTKIDQSHLSEIERLIENISKHCYLPKRGDGLLRGVELTGAVPVRYRRVQRFRLLHSRRRP